jgi:two-component system LytT family response regulator
MKKLKCAYLDDDPFMHGVVKDFVIDSSTVEAIDYFSCPKKFLKTIPEYRYDVILLDIILPEIDGITIAKKLKDKLVVFITGEESVLKEALSLAPIDVLTKPLSKHRFDIAIEKAQLFLVNKRQSEEYKVFHCIEPKGNVQIKVQDIIYVRGEVVDSRHKQIILKDGTEYVLSHVTFDELLSLSNSLVQINRIELVSIDAIGVYEYDFLTLKGFKSAENNKQLSINRVYRSDFFNRIEKRRMSLATL